MGFGTHRSCCLKKDTGVNKYPGAAYKIKKSIAARFTFQVIYTSHPALVKV